jgi:hypothetical protein
MAARVVDAVDTRLQVVLRVAEEATGTGPKPEILQGAANSTNIEGSKPICTRAFTEGALAQRVVLQSRRWPPSIWWLAAMPAWDRKQFPTANFAENDPARRRGGLYVASKFSLSAVLRLTLQCQPMSVRQGRPSRE